MLACAKNGSDAPVTFHVTADAPLKGFADSEGVIFCGYVVNPGVSAEYAFVLTGPGKEYTLTRTRPLTPGTFYRLPELSSFTPIP